MIIGIDLGTTNSAAARLADDGPQLIPNALGEALTPSVVGLDESETLLVGRAAKEFQVLRPDRCAGLFKRHMGSDWSVPIGRQIFTPVELSSLVLRTLKEDAAAHLGEAVSQAVITVPAYFNDRQRKATIRAGELAGLEVKRIINEPTAAAIAYGLHQLADEQVVVVIDLGGGTFDVSIVEMFEGTVEVRASSGVSFLGGEDFTRALAARVLESQGHVFEQAELKSPAMVSRMIQQCELAKCRLSRQQEAVVRVPGKTGDLRESSPTITIDRGQLGAWTDHLLHRIEMPIRRCLGDAGLKTSDIDEVILVGGATRMPRFVERVSQLLDATPRHHLNPDEVVALGAAVQAGLVAQDASLEDLVVTDVAPFTLGIAICKQLGTELRDGYYLPIIHRNTTIPVSRVERVSTVQANQTELSVVVYQGESRRVKENLKLGSFEVRNVPRGPAGQEIDIRFTYDLNGVLEVEATVVKTKQAARLVITRHAKGLSEQEIAAAVGHMQRLKTHPRDQSGNRFLVKRAERIYRELPLEQRGQLEHLLDGFEAALQMQDPAVIEQHRIELTAFLDWFERGFEGNSLDDYDNEQ
jgi:molecular chaperone HscC